MGRPRVYDEPRVATAIRLPSSLHHRLQQAAAASHVSVNLLVTHAVADFLQRLPSAEEWDGNALLAPARAHRPAERCAR